MKISEKNGFEKFRLALMTAASANVKTTILGNPGLSKIFLENFKNLITDEPGEKYFQRELSLKDQQFQKLYFGFSEISNSYEVLIDTPNYVKTYPSKQIQISKTRFLRYHASNYLNEIYILKMRLESYITVITRMYKKSIDISVVRKANETIDILLTGLDGIVNLRGKHVHHSRFEDEDLMRLGYYELFTKTDAPHFKKIYEYALKLYKEKWITIFNKNNKTIKKILNIYFFTLYRIIFGENGNWISPL